MLLDGERRMRLLTDGLRTSIVSAIWIHFSGIYALRLPKLQVN